MKILIFILFALFVVSCDKDEEQRVPIKVTNVNLNDAGEIKPYVYEFEAIPGDSGVQKCRIRTLFIHKGDTIQRIEAFLTGNYLSIEVVSFPYEFGCDSCWTVQDLTFDLKGINKGVHTVRTQINYNETKEFNYTFE